MELPGSHPVKDLLPSVSNTSPYPDTGVYTGLSETDSSMDTTLLVEAAHKLRQYLRSISPHDTAPDKPTSNVHMELQYLVHAINKRTPAATLLGSKFVGTAAGLCVGRFSRLTLYFEGVPLAELSTLTPDWVVDTARPEDKIIMRGFVTVHKDRFSTYGTHMPQPEWEEVNASNVNLSRHFHSADITAVEIEQLAYRPHSRVIFHRRNIKNCAVSTWGAAQ
jgi:hypothetical protein